MSVAQIGGATPWGPGGLLAVRGHLEVFVEVERPPRRGGVCGGMITRAGLGVVCSGLRDYPWENAMVIVDAVSSMWQMVPMGGLPNPHPEAPPVLGAAVAIFSYL